MSGGNEVSKMTSLPDVEHRDLDSCMARCSATLQKKSRSNRSPDDDARGRVLAELAGSVVAGEGRWGRWKVL